VEGVDRAVGGNVPLLGQARHDLGAAALELDDAVVDPALPSNEVPVVFTPG
jgi:hypothetical protein